MLEPTWHDLWTSDSHKIEFDSRAASQCHLCVILSTIQRAALQKDCIRQREKIAPKDGFEPVVSLISIQQQSGGLVFDRGRSVKALFILETVGSNPFLTQKILKIEAKKPFISVRKPPDSLTLLGIDEGVRTLQGKGAEWA